MVRHVARRKREHPQAYYLKPTLIRGAYINEQGRRVPKSRHELPDALFAPGVSTEEGLMSDVAQGRAQLFFHQLVDIKSNDSVETTAGGTTIRWSVEGHPKHWPKGTELVLQRAS